MDNLTKWVKQLTTEDKNELSKLTGMTTTYLVGRLTSLPSLLPLRTVMIIMTYANRDGEVLTVADFLTFKP
jgi:hypothetical protein